MQEQEDIDQIIGEDPIVTLKKGFAKVEELLSTVDPIRMTMLSIDQSQD